MNSQLSATYIRTNTKFLRGEPCASSCTSLQHLQRKGRPLVTTVSVATSPAVQSNWGASIIPATRQSKTETGPRSIVTAWNETWIRPFRGTQFLKRLDLLAGCPCTRKSGNENQLDNLQTIMAVRAGSFTLHGQGLSTQSHVCRGRSVVNWTVGAKCR